MSACLLSLSVISLVLPTAFHASFSDGNAADKAVLPISRGTSVILLLVYVLYLLFQLKSHAYMYQSTPQHVIDEESVPGFLHDMLNSSSSSDTSSALSSDSDGSAGSHTTAKRIKRALRGRRHRKSSVSSKETASLPSAVQTPSDPIIPNTIARTQGDNAPRHHLGAIGSGDEADTDGEHGSRCLRDRVPSSQYRDFENEKLASGSKFPKAKRKNKSKRKHRHHKHHKDDVKQADAEKAASPLVNEAAATPHSPRVEFVPDIQQPLDNSVKRPFNLRGLSSKILTSTVFSAANPTGSAGGPVNIAVPDGPSGLRRASSLPVRFNKAQSANGAPSDQHLMTRRVSTQPDGFDDSVEPKKYISRTSAVVLLLVSTGLVALCAEFLVSSINYLVETTSVSQAFIGLIILPIVGNAAEHVTAVTVASKNKMDLAIGVAVGSSIQIALFVTPVIVLLGWCLSKDMSLYFSLFETVSLFVSAFIINFLILDGRSNYLEGALLIAAYIIIAVGAFFYPSDRDLSSVG
ncbi:MAG: hypothetical protein M1830_002594 [Pleopsidium flavum]|nr:MAG: hypothetical protein M1830_002594 [Pleopsidium flavum]